MHDPKPPVAGDDGWPEGQVGFADEALVVDPDGSALPTLPPFLPGASDALAHLARQLGVDAAAVGLPSGGSPQREAVVLRTDTIEVRGAHQHNLRHIDVSIPRSKLVVITGVSGSGKSSLAFDTIYAEGQRRYVESVSPFIRQYLDKVEKPKVEYIGGLSPAIAIEQKTVSKNPRSTVGTITEISTYLRLLFSRAGTSHCLACGTAVQPVGAHALAEQLVQLPERTAIRLAPFPAGADAAPGDGELLTIPAKRERAAWTTRLIATAQRAFQDGGGRLVAWIEGHAIAFTNRRMCPACALEAAWLSASAFSPNSPAGMCPECKGLGARLEIDPAKIVEHPHRSLLDGASRWFGSVRKKKGSAYWQSWLVALGTHYNIDLTLPWADLPAAFQQIVLYGSGEEQIAYSYQADRKDRSWTEEGLRIYPGVVREILRIFRETTSEGTRRHQMYYMRHQPCGACGGERLCREARAVTLGGATIAMVNRMSLAEALDWLERATATLGEETRTVCAEAIAQIRERLTGAISVGLHYLTLDRQAPSLSGGEGQRIRLASQLGGGLVGVLYVLDEPSIGLHMRDQEDLIAALERLRDRSNTVIVVEHDEAMMRAADWIIDLGPGAGVQGGELIAEGTPAQVAANERSLTGRYLRGALRPGAVRQGARRTPTRWLTLAHARLHNLKDVSVRLPLNVFTCVSGVSGSGKSSLISKTLEPALSALLGGERPASAPDVQIEGAEQLARLITITQDPIGRTPRSNPATYVGIFDTIRDIFATTPEAAARGYAPDRFSFNVAGGRCEECQGHGQTMIEMHFLSDVWVVCKACKGARYNRETLEILYQGKTISEVLELDVATAMAFFADEPKITRILGTLCEVGLGYITLGQSATTFSGGEAQRIKLARELSRTTAGRTLYILDEPTTGLHPADIDRLLEVLHRLVDAGNTVLVIEHNLEVMRTADWMIDLGPEGGERGGAVVAEGPPEQIARVAASHTGRFLRAALAGIPQDAALLEGRGHP
ncbi:MAG TPA: excinuclease ABC subunit UvrA [Roseiflexaceae bacterium]|nr:excinuclease ABC subunit UvrA [Roseiflexaceae bacterium]